MTISRLWMAAVIALLLGLFMTVAPASSASAAPDSVTNANAPAAENGTATFRFYQGVTTYIANPAGKAFDITVDVRDWNLMENGPREVLFKVYDPDGRLVRRQVIEDDGIQGHAYQPEAGGWDHEMWYHLLNYARGSQPMIAWSSLTSATRVNALAKRTFTQSIEAGKPGIYRVMLMGSRDHVATLHVGADLKFGLAGHPMWMHGHGDMFKKTYVYVPKGTLGIDFGFAEYDQPVTRSFRVTTANGRILWDGPATGGFQSRTLKFDKPGELDDQILTLEVSAGEGDYMLHLLMLRDDVRLYRGTGGAPAIYAPDAATAKQLQGGAIYHDGKVFWHGFQVRYHDWLKNNLKDDDYIVRDTEGKVVEPTPGKSYGWGTPSMEYKGLGEAPGFIPLNGVHEAPPLSDSLMHNYQAHKNRNVLNVALRDLQEGLRMIIVGDMPVINRWSGNLGYVFGTYGWHYWRPSWRILQQSDAPQEVKAIIQEAMILCGDRLAFARGIERTNGNAMSHIPMALRYAAEATQDELTTELADVYLERFRTGGWGRGSGISASGDCQEHFAHDFHYGTYIYANYTAIVRDLDDERFKAIRDRIANLYSYLWCPEVSAYPWGSRTAQPAGLGSGNWKGRGGDSFTVNVNGGGDWFAARRPNYYMLTFHGRLAPEWLNHYFGTKMGYGGGIIANVSVPGYGPVIASTLSGKYGAGMQQERWRNFNIHSVVGEQTNGKPFVAADSEHLNAKLVGNTVTGDGEIRQRPAHVTRSYTYNDDHIRAEVSFKDTAYRAGYQGRGERAMLREAYEMIPYIEGKGARTTKISLYNAGEQVGDIKSSPMASVIVLDRGGYGVQILLDEPHLVSAGANETVLIHLIDKPTLAQDIRLSYTIAPYAGEPVIGQGGIAIKEYPMADVGSIDSLKDVQAKLAAVEPRPVAAARSELASVRVAMAGKFLAIDAQVKDANITQTDPPWKGSSFEIFASPSEGSDIKQVFMLPAASGKPAAGLIAASPRPQPADDIKLQTTDTDGGYRLQALIPLERLGLDAAAQQFRLEFQVGAVAAKKLTYGTAFGSRMAYQNNTRYGRFVREK